MARDVVDTTRANDGANMVDQARALAQLPENLALMKIQNDQIQTMAVARPRNLESVLANLKQQLSIAPEFAAKAIYSKPVGREPDRCIQCDAEIYAKRGAPAHAKCPVCKADFPKNLKPGEMKFAEGLSIHAAETIAEAYKYNQVETTAENIDESSAKITATFVDLQNGRITRRSRVVSKFQRRRSGDSVRVDDDRFWEVLIPGAQSRLLREVILRSIPAGLKSELEKAARAACEKSLDSDAIEKIVRSFASKNVSRSQLEKFLTRQTKQWTTADRAKLAAVWAAIEDGEAKVADMFDVVEADEPRGNDQAAKAKGASNEAEVASNETDADAESDPEAAGMFAQKRLQEICKEAGILPRKAAQLIAQAMDKENPFDWIQLAIEAMESQNPKGTPPEKPKKPESRPTEPDPDTEDPGDADDEGDEDQGKF